MEEVVYVNGEFLPKGEAKLSVYDHGLLYGDGIFEGIRAYNKRVFKLDRHITRLYRSARAIKLTVPHTPEEMGDLILETCRRNRIENGYIRPLVTRGPGDLGLDPRKCKAGAGVVIIATQWDAMYGDRYEKGLRLITSSVRRVPPECLSPSIKSMNYLNQILAKLQANEAGADEALLLDVAGWVSEASADNFFIVHDGVLLTPPTSTNLPGITRETVLELSGQLGVPAEERFFTLFEAYTAEEAFMTGTAAEIAPVVQLDGRAIGEGAPGEVTRRLMEAYRDLVRSTGTPIYA
jgi:branched-chain amino acid aminotransferase